jgi:hypothetical protein
MRKKKKEIKLKGTFQLAPHIFLKGMCEKSDMKLG